MPSWARLQKARSGSNAVPRRVFISGLPGVGKSTVAQALVAKTGAVWVRIDTIEAAISTSVLAPDDVADAGYRVAAAQADDFADQGQDVIIDCVLADALGRAVYGPRLDDSLIVELVCRDAAVHRARIEARHSSTPGTPDWAMASARAWEPWDRPVMVLDTAVLSADAAAQAIAEAWT